MSDKCPDCDGEIIYDEVDVGVGVLKGNPRCHICGWSPPELDLFKESL